MTRVAVVTLVHGRAEHLARQHASLARSTRRPDDYVVVAMDDPDVTARNVDGLRNRVLPVPTTPLGLPLAAARNAGFASAIERGADVVVGLDVDCLAGADLVGAYADLAARRTDTVWSGPVTYLEAADSAADGGADLLDRLPALDRPHPARPAPAPGEVLEPADADLFWSLSFSLAASTWERIGGFCEDYAGYGGEDTDFAHVATTRGVRFGWVGSARAYHQHHPVERPPVGHLDDILRNGETFHRRWGTWPMTGWLTEFERLGLVRRAGDGWRRSA